jgi:HK97 family phage portal protein
MNLFGYEITKARISPVSTNRGNSAGKVVDVAATTWEQQQGKAGHVNYSKYVAQYGQWVYVCVTKNSGSVARYPLKLYAKRKSKNQKVISKHIPVPKDFREYMESMPHLRKYSVDAEDVVEIIEHPILDLFNRVNPQMNRFDLFELTEMFLELTGNAYWYMVLNNLHLPEQIWIIPSPNMEINIKGENTSSGDFIKGYTYTQGLKKIEFKKEEILHFLFPSPFSSLYGMGPTAAGQQSITFDVKSRGYENVLLDNQCRPDVILSTEQVIPEAAGNSFMARLRGAYSGRKGLGKWMLLDRGLKASPLNLPLREMGFLQGRKATKEEIAGLFGVPLSKLTTEDVNLANAEIGEIQYIRDTIYPRLVRFEEKINEGMIPFYDENLFVSYGKVIPNDKNARLTELKAHLETQYSCINEERRIDGKEPVEWGEKPTAIQEQERAAEAAKNQPPAPFGPQNVQKPVPDQKVPPASNVRVKPGILRTPKTGIGNKLNPAEKAILAEEIMKRVNERLTAQIGGL